MKIARAEQLKRLGTVISGAENADKALFRQHRAAFVADRKNEFTPSWLQPVRGYDGQPGGGYDEWKRFKFNRMPSDAALGRAADTAVSRGPCLPEEQYDITQRFYVVDLIYCIAIQMQRRTVHYKLTFNLLAICGKWGQIL